MVCVLCAILIYDAPIIYKNIPSDAPNQYTDKIKYKLPLLDRAQVEVYNYHNYEAGANLLTQFTPQTTGEQAVANNIIDYINNNGIEFVGHARGGISIIKDNRGDIIKAEENINTAPIPRFEMKSDSQNVHSSATSSSLQDINN
jgi:hypothetical protein